MAIVSLTAYTLQCETLKFARVIIVHQFSRAVGKVALT